MSEIWFAIKMLIATVVVLFLLQIKLGEKTFEQRAHLWIQTSPLTEQLRLVSAGGIHAVSDGFARLSHSIASHFHGRKQQPGQRLNLNFERSKEYLREKKRAAEEKLEAWRESKNADD